MVNLEAIKKYVCVEIGKSAYTEYRMLSGEFEKTEDGIFLGIISAVDKSEAMEHLRTSEEYQNRIFDNVIFFEVVNIQTGDHKSPPLL